jgi:hypothetical protein
MELFRHAELRRAHSHNDESQENREEGGFDSFSLEMNNIFLISSDLKTAQADFEKFIHVVSEDLATKINQLKSIKSNENAQWNERSYASLQVIMLNQYVHRINRFRVVSRNSLKNLSSKVNEDKGKIKLVDKHIDTLAKLKRRLKHILDVSDKYAVEDLFDGINLLNDISDDVDKQAKSPNAGRKSKIQYKSLISLQKSILDDKSKYDGAGANDEKAKGKEINNAEKKKVHNWRSLTDHLSVLTKTYTNRR